MHCSTARLGLAAALVVAVALAGCHKTHKTTRTASTGSSTVAMGAINDKCPESGKPVQASGGTTTYKGHTIGFCCPKCIKPFEEMSAKDKDAFVAKYTKP